MTAAPAERPAAPVPVLDVGGTHVTAALVDPVTGHPVPSSVIRRPLGSHADADGILDDIALTALRLPAGHGPSWGVAMPGPFDYVTGIGRFAGIGKFESLSGVDVGAGLRRRLLDRAGRLCFLNDADAFALGEHRAGAARGHDRVVCLTLGTGIGSSFLRAGLPVHDGPDVPPDGHVHRLSIDGRPLEETVSRRAIRLHHARLTTSHREPAPHQEPDARHEFVLPDVHELAVSAAQGDTAASEVFRYAFDALGRALAPWVDRFGATAVVVGGSMAQSWDLVRPALARGLAQADRAPVRVLQARQPASAPLIGAAHWVQGTVGTS
ncbi:glucokinase [Streptomyces sp. V3I8]|uniref:ROK family protein n=1 Tax=Streptomyces sp. V3I8 TaxID=3042279 RepID=UPI0027855D6E|nr:ROK family protein [Streptomyces sp. V3I8]MDQ1041313.1 glucokinase [Streptomyces sp. V3I8]